MEKLAVWTPLVVAGVLGLTVVANVFVTFEGGRYCRENIAEEAPELTAAYAFSESTLTRRLDTHWVSAVVLTSRDIGSDEVLTIVCHFEADNYVFERYEVLAGDRLERFKSLSRNRLNPLVWLDEWL
jgi:hypothetical protein